MKNYAFAISVCVLLAACNMFEVRKTGDDVAITKITTPADSAAQIAGMTVTPSAPTLQLDSVQLQKEPVTDNTGNKDTALLPPAKTINTGTVQPEELLEFAQTLTGVPYVYASTNPKVGFDCSGFITYVFNHFKIAVPRSSIDFTNVGKQIAVEDAKRGDLILFTGTDSTEKAVGHMGLVVSNDDSGLEFIHSTSGKAMGVTVTPFNAYYKKRFVRIARVFSQNDLP